MISYLAGSISYFLIYSTLVVCSPAPRNKFTVPRPIPLKINVAIPRQADDCLDGNQKIDSKPVKIPKPISAPFIPASYVPPRPPPSPSPSPSESAPPSASPFPDPCLPASPQLTPIRTPLAPSPPPESVTAQPSTEYPSKPNEEPGDVPEPPTPIPAPMPSPEPVAQTPETLLPLVPYPPGFISPSLPAPIAPPYAIQFYPIYTPLQIIGTGNQEDCAPINQNPSPELPVETTTAGSVGQETETPTTSVDESPPSPPLPAPELPSPTQSPDEKFTPPNKEGNPCIPEIQQPVPLLPLPLPGPPPEIVPSAPSSVQPCEPNSPSIPSFIPQPFPLQPVLVPRPGPGSPTYIPIQQTPVFSLGSPAFAPIYVPNLIPPQSQVPNEC